MMIFQYRRLDAYHHDRDIPIDSAEKATACLMTHSLRTRSLVHLIDWIRRLLTKSGHIAELACRFLATSLLPSHVR